MNVATIAPITLQSVFELVRDDLLAIEREFGDDTASDVGVITEIGEYLRNGGGKRIRPALLLLSAKLCGYEGQGAIRLGAVVATFSCVLLRLYSRVLVSNRPVVRELHVNAEIAIAQKGNHRL